MKKIVIMSLISLAAFVFASRAEASGLDPEYCTLESRPKVFTPITYVGFGFDCAIEVAENSTAAIYCGDELIVTKALSVSNYYGDDSEEGTLIIDFEDAPLVLPKGKSYRLVVDENMICKKGSLSVTNDRLEVDFEVPATLGKGNPDIDEDGTVVKSHIMGFYFNTEIALLDSSAVITLLREGVPVRTYPCDVSWDWDLGHVNANLSKSYSSPIYFENGVRYTLQLPANAVSALYRADITNEATEVNFIGGYTEPLEPLNYVWCSLFDNHPDGILNEVSFYYDRPVSLSEKPIVQLCEDGNVIKEVVPTLSDSESGDMWILTADFGGVELKPLKGYSITIPAGTLVTAEGDVVVNPVSTLSINDLGVAAGARTETFAAKAESGFVILTGINPGDAIGVFTPDGKMIYIAMAESSDVSIPVEIKGILLISVNGIVQKIVMD